MENLLRIRIRSFEHNESRKRSETKVEYVETKYFKLQSIHGFLRVIISSRARKGDEKKKKKRNVAITTSVEQYPCNSFPRLETSLQAIRIPKVQRINQRVMKKKKKVTDE